jgi:hypothetical protein
MACQFSPEEINELLTLVAGGITTAEAAQAGAPHSNQALMQQVIDTLMGVEEKLNDAADGSGACVFTLEEINELLALVTTRYTALNRESSNAMSHSNMHIADLEFDLLQGIEAKLEAAAATAAGPNLSVPNSPVAAANVAAVNAANAAQNAAVANVAAQNAAVNAALASAAANNANVSSNYFPVSGGRHRRRHARKTRKARKGRKTRKGRKGTRRGRKGSRRA